LLVKNQKKKKKVLSQFHNATGRKKKGTKTHHQKVKERKNNTPSSPQVWWGGKGRVSAHSSIMEEREGGRKESFIFSFMKETNGDVIRNEGGANTLERLKKKGGKNFS